MFSRKLVLTGFLAATLGVFSTTAPTGTALAACSPGDKINASTAADAVRALEAAGYTQVHPTDKGCDNAWHATAMLDGKSVFVVWNAEGQVVTEGN